MGKFKPDEPLPDGPRLPLRDALDWLTPDQSRQTQWIQHLRSARGLISGSPIKIPIPRQYFQGQVEFTRGPSEGTDELRPVGDSARPSYREIDVERNEVREIKKCVLLDDVYQFRRTPEQAEAEAKRLRIGPLLEQPDPSVILEESQWPFPMALAWLVWGDPAIVCHYWPEWWARCQYWKRIAGPDGTPQPFVPSLLQAKVTFACVARDFDVWISQGKQSRRDVATAEAMLWQALQSGKLEADGFDPTTKLWTPIPGPNFRHLRPCAIVGQSEEGLRNSFGKEFWTPTVGRDGLLALEPPIASNSDKVGRLSGSRDGLPPSAAKKSNAHRRGRRKSYHCRTFFDILDSLFDQNGPIGPDSDDWNSRAKVQLAMIQEYQKKHPHESRVPSASWAYETVRKYLTDKPHLDPH